MPRLRAIALACVALGPAVLVERSSAQTVLVRVLDDVTSEPVLGAIAHLIDDEGAVLRSALTDEQGRALFPAVPAARYRARAEMIGRSTSESGTFTVTDGAATVRELRLVPRPVRLAALDVNAERRACTARPAEEGRALAGVWDDARKALTAAALTEQQNLYRYETLTFEREELLDTVGTQSESRRQGIRRLPFETLPPADLAERGFVRFVGTDFVYYAPDANVLLSNEFTDSHCFRLVAGPAGGAVVGIGFEPLERRRSVVDIEGTLWLDRETAELRWLDYAYTNLDLGVRAGARGRVAFERTPSGRWIVPDWWIEMPILGARVLGDGSRRVELRGTRRAGGRVLELVEGGGRAIDGLGAGGGPRGGIEGIVVDSVGAPVAGARVGAIGWTQESFTDARGVFALLGMPVGTYDVRVVDPRWAGLGLEAPRVTREVIAGEASYVQLYLPPVAELLRAACADQVGTRAGAALVGRVLDAAGSPIAGATVRTSDGLATTTGPDGAYRLCGVSRGERLEIGSTVGDVERSAGGLTIGRGEAGAIFEIRRD